MADAGTEFLVFLKANYPEDFAKVSRILFLMQRLIPSLRNTIKNLMLGVKFLNGCAANTITAFRIIF